MESIQNCILTINAGSSSIKFAVYEMDVNLRQLRHGQTESIGLKTTLRCENNVTGQKSVQDIETSEHDVSEMLIDWLGQQDWFGFVKAVGHRVVHGMEHTQPEHITAGLLTALQQIRRFDPEHLPQEIKLMQVLARLYPALPQIACFDTSFHAGIPQVAKLLPIPRRYYSKGIRKYGFHGLSYQWLVEQLSRSHKDGAKGKVILAHLGNGASLAAVRNGKSVDTSMGFTPTSGLPMSTRTGDLDPGVAWYLMQTEKLSPHQFSHLINHESGLLGISESSSDMRELLAAQNNDSRAAEAVELFCYQTKKWIGSFAAVLGGLDTLVFSGGIGEHIPEIRERICQGLDFLGIAIDPQRNNKNEPIISKDSGRVLVRVIPANEELMIARSVYHIFTTQ